MQKEPPPFVWAVPDEKNILYWNFLIRGPPDSPYAGGEYHGCLIFPAEYPFKPPGIKMLTPSGRFHPNKKICFSMSDFHPGSWNPAWSVATILTGLLSFMLSDEMTTGSVTSTDGHKRTFAARSHAWNVTQKAFREAFPEHSSPELLDLPNMGERDRGKPKPKPSLSVPAPSPCLTSAPSAASSSTIVADAQTLPVQAGPVKPHKIVDTRSAGSWAAGWGQLFWDKWRWGALIALAVVVSRLSGSG